MHKNLIIVFVVVLILFGTLLRFFNIEHVFPYGWDQSRDAYQVKYILQGNFLLDGPQTGVGHFHLGPLWFYLLVPFFFFTQLDPIASQYLNIIITVITLGTLFYITKKLFSTLFAFLALGMYATNAYLIGINRTPWNVSLIPVLSILIFYFLFKTFQEKKYKWVIALMSACGIAFHVHFTSVVFPLILCFLCLINKDKKKIFLLYLKGLPFYIIWFIPTLVSYFAANQVGSSLIQNFLKYYFVGIHLQFVLHRLPDIFIQFKTLLSLPLVVGYVIFLSNAVLYFRTSATHKLYIKIMSAWMFAFLAIFGVYGGQISEYYFLFTLPIVYYSFFLFIQWLFQMRYKVIPIVIVSLFLGYYSYQNIIHFPKNYYGLAKQKEHVKKQMKKGKQIPYNEGDIESYLYLLYKK